MEVHFKCDECESNIGVEPSGESNAIKCDICNHVMNVNFSQKVCESSLDKCPKCDRKDFYKQKDFNRKIGVVLFVIAACLVPWTYGVSLPVAFLIDYFLFKRLSWIAICYKCDTVFRSAKNIQSFTDFNHEMHDRIKYSDHDFDGVPLEH